MSSRDTYDYVFVGGGSGGHITPLVSIAEVLKRESSSVKIAHIGQKNDVLNDVIAQSRLFDGMYTVQAGKYRRYHGERLISRLTDYKTFVWNVRDFFRFTIGIVQAWVVLGRIRPKVIFMKGGYVCAAVGIAARLRHIPYITHDSDAMVSLAHRIIAKHAVKHLTALDQKYYTSYDQSKTIQVGVPVRSTFTRVTESDKKRAREHLSIDIQARVVLIVGGGLGAQSINNTIAQYSDQLLHASRLFIIHVTGQKLYEETKAAYERIITNEMLKSRCILVPFTQEMDIFGAAADIVVTRAGATNMAELAAQGKPCIIVPNPLLAGGHQTKNANALKAQDAVIVVEEHEISQVLVPTIIELIQDETRQQQLGDAFFDTFMPRAAEKIAEQLKIQIKDKEQD